MAFGFAGVDNYVKMGSDPRFWNSLVLTAIYTASTVLLQVVIGLALALLVLQIPKGQGLLRVAAILPIVLAPVVVGLFWRTLVLAPEVGLVDMVTRSLGLGSHNWLGDPQLALISVIAIHTWQWTPSPSWCCWPRSRPCRPTSTKPPASTAPAPGSASSTSRCR